MKKHLELNTSLNGLSETEAQERLKKYGYNEVRKKKENPLLKFLKKFWAPVPWMLEVTIILGKYLDKTGTITENRIRMGIRFPLMGLLRKML